MKKQITIEQIKSARRQYAKIFDAWMASEDIYWSGMSCNDHVQNEEVRKEINGVVETLSEVVEFTYRQLIRMEKEYVRQESHQTNHHI